MALNSNPAWEKVRFRALVGENRTPGLVHLSEPVGGWCDVLLDVAHVDDAADEIAGAFVDEYRTVVLTRRYGFTEGFPVEVWVDQEGDIVFLDDGRRRVGLRLRDPYEMSSPRPAPAVRLLPTVSPRFSQQRIASDIFVNDAQRKRGVEAARVNLPLAMETVLGFVDLLDSAVAVRCADLVHAVGLASVGLPPQALVQPADTFTQGRPGPVSGYEVFPWICGGWSSTDAAAWVAQTNRQSFRPYPADTGMWVMMGRNPLRWSSLDVETFGYWVKDRPRKMPGLSDSMLMGWFEHLTACTRDSGAALGLVNARASYRLGLARVEDWRLVVEVGLVRDRPDEAMVFNKVARIPTKAQRFVTNYIKAWLRVVPTVQMALWHIAAGVTLAEATASAQANETASLDALAMMTAFGAGSDPVVASWVATRSDQSDQIAA